MVDSDPNNMTARQHWIFAYGSIIWKRDFDYQRAELALIRGYERRFWQGSPDHRGTPTDLGRVLTLIPQKDSHCHGLALAISEQQYHDSLARLDQRESGGYTQLEIDIHLLQSQKTVRGLVYFAGPENEHYLGPASLTEMARHIRSSRGPSGPNLEYFWRLYDTLRELEIHDSHMEELARELELAEPRSK